MRKLTIQRKKSFVACLGKFKVYAEDSSGELTIRDVPCRKLGELKNGAEETFLISERAQKIFVIADQASKEYCNDFVKVPAGSNDVSYTGQCRFNPTNGNAFRFDDVTDEEVLANRKAAGKRGGFITVLSIFIGFLVGFVLVQLMLK